ncbi:MAG: hypothetical protein M8841_04265 [marine benthic group bacterium]|jgi:hypothetical protein|nr:hypothetical protein [Gemmatimonadota bacterium]MCL7968243.1 hypothetical protein [Gemmatimonadota bacterium]MCL7975126.1 hypothetical protein [Gemmatimonadota bacterium]MCL7981763.1 hypothetical protein [Gemmatimonadota bacterium]MCL7985386.1 hypothetical protein [Gemmatimonadota bacterium]
MERVRTGQLILVPPHSSPFSGDSPRLAMRDPTDLTILKSAERSADSGTDSIDTRHPGSPLGRVYAAPYARVWDVLHDEINRRRLWSVVHSDEDLGLLTAVCRSWLPGEVGHITVWVRLDDNALTRVDVRAWRRPGVGLPGGSKRRVRTIVAGLDRKLGREALVAT